VNTPGVNPARKYLVGDEVTYQSSALEDIAMSRRMLPSTNERRKWDVHELVEGTGSQGVLLDQRHYLGELADDWACGADGGLSALDGQADVNVKAFLL